MNNLAKIAVAIGAFTVGAAFAQSDSDADQARRARNMDEVLAKHNVHADGTGSATEAMPENKPTLRARSHQVAETARQKTHHVVAATREESHHVAQSTRDFTHRQADKVRSLSDRQKSDRAPAKTPESTS